MYLTIWLKIFDETYRARFCNTKGLKAAQAYMIGFCFALRLFNELVDLTAALWALG
jgi:hypothetical protein